MSIQSDIKRDTDAGGTTPSQLQMHIKIFYIYTDDTNRAPKSHESFMFVCLQKDAEDRCVSLCSNHVTLFLDDLIT